MSDFDGKTAGIESDISIENLHKKNKVSCSNVFVTSFANSDRAYATSNIKEGELLERGLARRLTNFNGSKNQFTFKWNDEQTWAICSGCAPYYSASSNANSKMVKLFDKDQFEIYATRDILANEELSLGLELRSTISEITEPKILCSNVVVLDSPLGGDGAYAACDIKQGDLVERGIIRRFDIGSLNGHENPYVFTWSNDGSVWALGSGASTFYNTAEEPNTKMIRYFEEDRFEIFALKDIKVGEELTHIYKSKKWRECFKPLNS